MNNGNLKRGNPATQFKSGREAVENGRKGGKASAATRGFRNVVKKQLKEHPELYEETYVMLANKARNGDLKAVEMLVELAGESPKQMEIALKKKELKLKEKAKDVSATVLEKLDEVLGGIDGGF